MARDELTSERIEAVRQWAERDRDMRSVHVESVMGKRCSTVLALIESRKQALELLMETRSEIAVAGSMSIGLFDRIRDFLEQNQ